MLFEPSEVRTCIIVAAHAPQCSCTSDVIYQLSLPLQSSVNLFGFRDNTSLKFAQKFPPSPYYIFVAAVLLSFAKPSQPPQILKIALKTWQLKYISVTSDFLAQRLLVHLPASV
ncbi:hypothetical protein GDO86_005430 [Hymenochirus boettgeri]|uniref:Uncharacterized protein n=1 Tax=Hymenochirus boettgeri TaxID=247094 RepID=A0A8T2J6W7_9PIPI|nr:hypothetical protein GDO86_005430 [Hymenochirus boettgeri]